jgi:hypothetical protein
MKTGWVSIQLKELKKKINSFLWCNFNLRGDKGKGVGKL